jgi:hypothetical protein
MDKLTRIILLSGATFCASLNPVLAAMDTVVVTATIQEVITVSITPNSNGFDVTAGTAITDQDIATISINSNDPNGYNVTLAGTHATSVLQNAAADETMAYTVKYNGASAIGLTDTATNVESVTTQTEGAVNRSLTLSIAGSESTGKSAEAFTDTITVEIAGK